MNTLLSEKNLSKKLSKNLRNQTDLNNFLEILENRKSLLFTKNKLQYGLKGP